MEETKKHEHACCGGHGKEMAGCSCLDKPWMRILILFCAALVIFFMGVCTASKTNGRFEERRLFDQRFSGKGGCPMLNADTTPTDSVSSTNATPSSTCGQEKNTGCPMRQAE